MLAACFDAGQPVVPMGGLTGLVQGATAGPGEIGLSFERMNRIEAVDARDRTPSAITLLDFRRMDFPGRLNNCETCHKAGTYDVELPANVLPWANWRCSQAVASA